MSSMKRRWLYWALGVCIAYIVLCLCLLPNGIFVSDTLYYSFWVSYIVANLLFIAIIIINNHKLAIYLLGLAVNTVYFIAAFMADVGGYVYAFKAATIIALTIYTIIVLIALSISYSIKKIKCKQNES